MAQCKFKIAYTIFILLAMPVFMQAEGPIPIPKVYDANGKPLKFNEESLQLYNEAETIFQSCQEQDLGYPFDQKKLYSLDMYRIGKRISEMAQSGLLTTEMREQTIRDVLKENVALSKSYPFEGSLNLGALQGIEPNLDVRSVFACLVLAARTGEIEDVVPFLIFCKVFIANIEKTGMLSFYEVEKYRDVTLEQRVAFYPAANAILSHPDVTKPLLIKAWQNERLPDLLRLQAGFFLKKIQPDLINDFFIALCMSDRVQQLFRCGLLKESRWNTIHMGICEKYTVSPEREQQRKEYDERINQRMKGKTSNP